MKKKLMVTMLTILFCLTSLCSTAVSASSVVDLDDVSLDKFTTTISGDGWTKSSSLYKPCKYKSGYEIFVQVNNYNNADILIKLYDNTDHCVVDSYTIKGSSKDSYNFTDLEHHKYRIKFYNLSSFGAKIQVRVS